LSFVLELSLGDQREPDFDRNCGEAGLTFNAKFNKTAEAELLGRRQPI